VSEAAHEGPADFDEAEYLRLNPDVAEVVAAGVLPSGREHYVRYGAREGRRYQPAVAEPAPAASDAPGALPGGAVEALRMSPGGGVFVTGWIDDAADPLAELLLEGDGWDVDLARVSLARTRRRDVEATRGAAEPYPFGFWSFVDLGRPVPRQATCRLTVRLASGFGRVLLAEVAWVPDADLRDAALAWLVDSDWSDSTHIGAVVALNGGAGAHIVSHNRRITAGIVADPYVERFGPAGGRPKASIVVCLYGRPEYLSLQNALFAGGAGMQDVEFIYVSNSPELADRLLRDARIGSLVHGIRQTLVLLPGNAGFGAANNAATRLAASDRIIACNPDVVPYQPDWAQRHAAVVDALPPAQTALFGVPLYYETGALMHGGMFFEIDTGVVARPGRMATQDLVRVQHYGKGAPPDSAAFLRPRPVPAVTGAFISCRRDWFERLGGFSEDFVFGHYEDADLCLRSLREGVAPWLHDVRLYHLEGAGSTRERVHEGSLLVNRWLFADRWSATLRDGLLGPQPTHPLLAEPRVTGQRRR
jgi:GT2 family glycosyltransferase